MVTCRQCGKPLAKECTCYTNTEYIKVYNKLASNETRVIDSVRNDNKKLFIESETTGIKKEAKIKKLAHYGIAAEEIFNGKEIGNVSPFFMILKEENGDVVYRRRFEDKLQENDTMTISWILDAKTGLDKVWFRIIGKIFGNKH